MNPHDANKAVCRAYRSGQKDEVDVIKLISKGTIEEDMLQLRELLSVNASTGGPGLAVVDVIQTSLIETIRQQPGATLATV